MHSVKVYSLVVRAPREKESTKLSDIGGKDLFDIIYQALAALQNTPLVINEGNQQKVYEVTSLTFDGRFLSWWVQSGQFGHKSTIKNVQSNQITHIRTNDEADQVPLFFMFHVGQDFHGFAVLHKFGQLGVKTVLNGQISQRFINEAPGHRLYMRPQVDMNAFNQYLEDGEVKCVRLVKYSPADDVADFARGLASEEEQGEIELRIKRPHGGILSKVKDQIGKYLGHSNAGVFTLIEDQAEDIKIDIDIGGGKSKTVSLKNPANIQMDIMLDGQVSINADGHPDEESITEYAKLLIDEQYANLAGQNE